MKLERRRHESIAEKAECGKMHPCLETAFLRIPRFHRAFCVQKEKAAPLPMEDAVNEQKHVDFFQTAMIFGEFFT